MLLPEKARNGLLNLGTSRVLFLNTLALNILPSRKQITKMLFKVGMIGKVWWRPVRWWLTRLLVVLAASLQTCCSLWRELCVLSWIFLLENLAQWPDLKTLLWRGHGLRSFCWIFQTWMKRIDRAVEGSVSSLAFTSRRFRILQIFN